MIPQRTKRVAELIKREISNIIQKDMQDPRLGFITVTKASVTNDLKLAKIWISIMGDENAKKECLKTLSHAQNRIRQILAGRVRLKYLPLLQFSIDDSIEYSAHIDEIITRLRKEEKWNE